MALEVKLVKTGSESGDVTVNYDGTETTWTDGTGTYDASDNTTGYGGANEALSDYARIVFGILHYQSGDTSKPANIYDATNTNLSLEWTIEQPKDAWTSFYLVLVPRHDSGTTYSSGDIVFKADNSVTPFRGTIEKHDGTQFNEISLTDLVETSNLNNLFYDKNDIYMDFQSRYKYNQERFDWEFDKTDISEDTQFFRILKQFMVLNTGETAFCVGNKHKSQKVLEAFDLD